MSDPQQGGRSWRRSPRVITGPAPAVGAELSIQVTAGRLWQPIGLLATLASSAVAGNRVARLQITDGNVVFLDLPPAAVQAASLSRVYQWAAIDTALAIGNGQLVPLPTVTLRPGSIIQTVTDAKDVGDAWSVWALLVMETWVFDGNMDVADVPDYLVELFAPLGE